jgi:predicted RNase H-like HicB family nuclease
MREEALVNIKVAIAVYVESLETHGEAVPPTIMEELVKV